MIPKALAELSVEDIRFLLENEVSERNTLEYKRDLPGSGDEDKREFLADVASFANSSGGDLIYGVSDRKDAVGRNTGIPDAIVGLSDFNEDESVRRIQEMIRSGISPRIEGISLRAVSIEGKGHVLVLRIPKSWNPPHMVTFKNLSRFFGRTSAGKYQFDVQEIRSLVLASNDLPEKVRQFRYERLSLIVGGDTPLKLPQLPKIVLHVIPVSGFMGIQPFDVKMAEQYTSAIRPLYSSTCSSRFNLDGLLTYNQMDDQGRGGAYVQVFRNGALESVEAQILAYSPKGILIQAVEHAIIKEADSYMAVLTKMGFAPPFVVALALVGVKGRTLDANVYRTFTPHFYPFDKDVLALPESVSGDDRMDAAQLLRPAFDAIWQAAGAKESLCYDASGKWVGLTSP